MERAPSNSATRAIRQEHDCLAALIRSMQQFTREIATGSKVLDVKVFRAMLPYISEPALE